MTWNVLKGLWIAAVLAAPVITFVQMALQQVTR
jgi:hypothetical protein